MVTLDEIKACKQDSKKDEERDVAGLINRIMKTGIKQEAAQEAVYYWANNGLLSQLRHYHKGDISLRNVHTELQRFASLVNQGNPKDDWFYALDRLSLIINVEYETLYQAQNKN